jgi:uncharacterized protein with GYD domain
MATYISLIQFTDQGIRNVKDTVKRGEATMAEAEKMGMKIIEELWTMGAYDVVALFEAPDDETMTAFAAQLAHWETSRPRPCAPSAKKRWKAFWRRSNSSCLPRLSCAKAVTTLAAEEERFCLCHRAATTTDLSSIKIC